MADLSDFKLKIQEMRDAVTARLPAIAETLTLTAKGLAEREIKEQGFGAMYSQNKIPAYFLHGKELNARGKKFLSDRGVKDDGTKGEAKKKRRKSKGDPDPGTFDTLTNWSEFRAAQGLQVDHVDASYSNKMWANMGPVRIEERGNTVVALLGATNEEAQKKMNYNYERYGDFIRKGITAEGGQILGDVVITEIEKVIDQFKL